MNKKNKFSRPDPRYVVSNNNTAIAPNGAPPSIEEINKFKAEARKAAGIKTKEVKSKDAN